MSTVKSVDLLFIVILDVGISTIFWEVADDIIADYFDDFIDHEVTNNIVLRDARIFVDVD